MTNAAQSRACRHDLDLTLSAMRADTSNDAVDLAEELEDAAEDGADYVLARCEAIAGILRQLLGQHKTAQGCAFIPSVHCSQDIDLSPHRMVVVGLHLEGLSESLSCVDQGGPCMGC